MLENEIIALINSLSPDEAKKVLELLQSRFKNVVAEALNMQQNEKDHPWYGNVKPISPEQVKVKIPDVVFEAVNELINENWNRDKIVLKQDEIVKRILKLAKRCGLKIRTNEIFDNNRLDFEDFYRKQGRKVDYDKPAYCEDYPATFSFSKPSKKQYTIY